MLCNVTWSDKHYYKSLLLLFPRYFFARTFCILPLSEHELHIYLSALILSNRTKGGITNFNILFTFEVSEITITFWDMHLTWTVFFCIELMINRQIANSNRGKKMQSYSCFRFTPVNNTIIKISILQVINVSTLEHLWWYSRRKTYNRLIFSFSQNKHLLGNNCCVSVYVLNEISCKLKFGQFAY